MQGGPTRDGAAVRFPPPLVPLIALVLGVGLQRAIAPLPIVPTGGMRFAAAFVFSAAGLGLMAAAMRLFQATGQDPKPWETTPAIISTGIYRFTRNPMYLGMGLLQAGIGFALRNGWVVALVPISWLIIYWIAIRHEEAYLTHKFAVVYQDYKASVRRWI